MSNERERALEAALEWYGEQARLARLIHSEGDPGRQALADDGGKRARALLASSPPHSPAVTSDHISSQHDRRASNMVSSAPPCEMRKAWRYDMGTVPSDGSHFIVLCTRMDEPPIAWQPYIVPAALDASGPRPDEKGKP